MADLFARKIDTLENRLARMPSEDALVIVQETQRRLQRTSGYRWAHLFLGDLTKQLNSGFVPRLSTKQIRHILIYAKHTGVEIPAPSTLKERENGEAVRQYS